MAQASGSGDTSQHSGSQMTDTPSAPKVQHTTETARSQSRDAHGGKHVHHGRTPAAWAGVSVAMVGLLLGAFALIAQNWVLFGVAGVLCLLALVVARVLQKMGYGAD